MSYYSPYVLYLRKFDWESELIYIFQSESRASGVANQGRVASSADPETGDSGRNSYDLLRPTVDKLANGHNINFAEQPITVTAYQDPVSASSTQKGNSGVPHISQAGVSDAAARQSLASMAVAVQRVEDKLEVMGENVDDMAKKLANIDKLDKKVEILSNQISVTPSESLFRSEFLTPGMKTHASMIKLSITILFMINTDTGKVCALALTYSLARIRCPSKLLVNLCCDHSALLAGTFGRF